MAKKNNSSTDSAHRGYRPLEEGYRPVKGVPSSQSGQSAQQQPKPPKGGTGQSPPAKNSE